MSESKLIRAEADLREALSHYYGYSTTMQGEAGLVLATKVRKVADALLAEAQPDNETYCAYCGARFPLDDKAATLVSEHIHTCPSHPMRKLEEELVMLRYQVEKAEAQPEGPGLREALERIIGMCGKANRCACGRPTGIPAIVSCAQRALAARPAEAGLRKALALLKQTHGAEDAFYALSAFLQGKPYPAEEELRKMLEKWFEKSVPNLPRLDWETGYRCARDEVRDMVNAALTRGKGAGNVES